MKRHWLIIGAIFVIAILTRGYVFTHYELWFDEAYSGLTVAAHWSSMFEIIVNDVHPPLYYVLLKLWVSVFGNSVFTIRLMSLVWSMLSIRLIYQVFQSKKMPAYAPYVAAFTMAVSPFFTDYGVEARQYSLLLCITLVALLQFRRAIEDTPNQYSRHWLFFSIALAAGFLTHYVFSLGIVVFAGLIVYHYRVQANSLREWFTLQCKVWVLPFVVFMAWLPILYSQITEKGSLHWVPQANYFDILRTCYAFFFGVYSHALGLPPVRELPFLSAEIIALIFGGVLLLGAAKIIKTDKDFSLITLYSYAVIPLFVVVFVSRLGVHVYVERFLTPYGTAVFILLLWLFFMMSKRTQVIIGTVYVFLVAGVFSTTYEHDVQYAPIAEYCVEQSCERVVFSDPLVYVQGAYYVKDVSAEYPVLLVSDKNKIEEYASWAIIDREQIILLDDVRDTDVYIDSDEFQDDHFEESAAIEGGFTVYTLLNNL